MLATGDIEPANEIATDTQRNPVPPHDGKKMVIFFFPRADTFSCTKESIQFSDLIEDFAASGVKVISILKDTSEKLPKFRKKHDLKCHLGAHHDTKISQQIGVWVEKSMYRET